MLEAVLLVLREVLEAALFVSLLLALTTKLGRHWRWSLAAIGVGLVGSWLLGHFAYAIAASFDGMGQELGNACLYGVAVACFIALNVMFAPTAFARSVPVFERRASALIAGLCALIVACSLAREGAEVWLYLSAFENKPNALSAAIVGGAIGTGIGMSLGALVYYLFLAIPQRYFLPLFVVLTSLVSAGLAMQVAQQLMQIGWVDSGRAMWDSSALVSEQSWLGLMLHTVFGYDANPDATQASFYLGVMVIVTLGSALHIWWLGRSRHA